MRQKQLPITAFPFVTFDKVRYGDTDRQGHVNNAVFATFFETGRVEMLYQPSHQFLSDDCSFVVAKSTIELIAEIHWPGQVDIGTGIVRIGNSSLVIAANLYQQGRLVATSETMVVQVNTQTKTSQALNSTSKSLLEKFILMFD
jgi:acyl-CoA thioester hydrolase